MLTQAHADAAAPITGIAAAPRASPAVQHLAAILRGPCGHYSGHDTRARRRELSTNLLARTSANLPRAGAEVELRFTPKLGRLMDQVLASGLPFSFVRIRDARR